MNKQILASALVLAFVGVAFAHNGVTWFMPTVPDPTAMNIDGSEDDWAWFDMGFAATPEHLEVPQGEGEGMGPNPIPDDFQASYRLSWSPPPDNALYFFTRVSDDTLRSMEGDQKDRWWNDDVVQLDIDTDHSGGSISGNSIVEECHNGYRTYFHAQLTKDLGVSVHCRAVDGREWVEAPPWNISSGTITPPDTGNLTGPYEWTAEGRLTLWDDMDPLADGPETSTRHIFAEDDVIGFSIVYEDGDWEANGEQSFFTHVGVDGGPGSGIAGATDADQMMDVHALLTISADDLENYGEYGGGGTATFVEHTTWARIKNAVAH